MSIRSELRRVRASRSICVYSQAGSRIWTARRLRSDSCTFDKAATRAAPPFATGATHLLGMRAERISPHHQRAGAVVGEELKQHRMRHLAVENHHALDARFERVDAG